MEKTLRIGSWKLFSGYYTPNAKQGESLAQEIGLPSPKRSRWASDTQEYYGYLPLPSVHAGLITRADICPSDDYAAIEIAAIVEYDDSGNISAVHKTADANVLAEIVRKHIHPAHAPKVTAEHAQFMLEAAYTAAHKLQLAQHDVNDAGLYSISLKVRTDLR